MTFNAGKRMYNDGPAVGAVLVDVSSADQEFSPPLRGVSIGTAGALEILTLNNEQVIIPANALATGIQHAIGIKKIFNAGTGASQIVGWR